MDLQAIIFDVDGTLAETEETHRQAFNKVFRDTNLDWDWSPELYRELLQTVGGKERIRAYLTRFHSDLLQFENTDVLIDALYRDKTAHFLRQVRAGAMPLRPGVMRLLTEARMKGLRLGIASTTNRSCILGMLRQGIGVRAPEWFEVILTGSDVKERKPSPLVYRKALEQMGLPAAACLAIEDSPIGVRAAASAGLPVVATVSDYFRGEEFPQAVAVIDHLGDPGQPFQVLRGEDPGKSWVDVETLRRWHAAALAAQAA